MATELVLEINRNMKDSTVRIGMAGGVTVLVTPAVDEDYWVLRVKVSPTQAVVGFPKFDTIGIGFAKEGDWNTNLPWSAPTEDIYQHIAHNRAGADPDTCRRAIRLVQDAVASLKLLPPERIARGLRLQAGLEDSPHHLRPRRGGN